MVLTPAVYDVLLKLFAAFGIGKLRRSIRISAPSHQPLPVLSVALDEPTIPFHDVFLVREKVTGFVNDAPLPLRWIDTAPNLCAQVDFRLVVRGAAERYGEAPIPFHHDILGVALQAALLAGPQDQLVDLRVELRILGPSAGGQNGGGVAARFQAGSVL